MPVTDKIIEPITKWFGKSIPEGKATVYYEVLGKYSDNILEKALLEIKATWKYSGFPQPAAIREVCEAELRKTKTNKGLTIHTTGGKHIGFWEAAEKIIKTPIGKIAFFENWTVSLIHSVMNGQQDFNDSDIEKFRSGHKAALNAVSRLHPANKGDDCLIKFWHSFCEKEQKVIDKYKHLMVGNSYENIESY